MTRPDRPDERPEEIPPPDKLPPAPEPVPTPERPLEDLPPHGPLPGDDAGRKPEPGVIPPSPLPV